ncbi:MAG: hypothetical protein CME70_18490 [Halobacteriovorax sp.]|nr:hypothetical protein [Halobacteriovorax sp.]
MRGNALDFFDEIYCIILNPDNKVAASLQADKAGVLDRVSFYTPPDFLSYGLPEEVRQEARVFYSYRNIFQRAFDNGSANVLVFLDSAVFIDLSSLREGLMELSKAFRLSRGMHWEVVLLGTDPLDNLVSITSHLFHVIRGCSLYCAGFNHTFIHPFLEFLGPTEEDVINAMKETGVRYNSFEDWIQRYKPGLNLLCIGPPAACVDPSLHHKIKISIPEQKDKFNFFTRKSLDF